jgi:hypothetical protein
MPNTHVAWVDLDLSAPIPVGILLEQVAEALHTKPLARVIAEENLKREFKQLVLTGQLVVLDRTTLGPHPCPDGAALWRAVLLPDTVVDLLAARGIGIRDRSAPLREQYAAQSEDKRRAGRYTLEEVAALLAKSGEARAESLASRLKAAATDGALPTYRPGETQRLAYGAAQGEQRDVLLFYEECFWDDVNNWLAQHEPRVTARIPDPSAKASPSPSNVTTVATEPDWHQAARKIAERIVKEVEVAGRYISQRDLGDRIASQWHKEGRKGPAGVFLSGETIKRYALKGVRCGKRRP